MSEYTIAQRVARGALLLDRTYPNWERRVDMEVFDIESLKSCVLGQVYGDWSVGTKLLALDGDRYRQEVNGFEMTETEYHSENVYLIRDQFAEAWADEVHERTI